MRDWLISLRKGKGLTQKEASQKIGISQPSYCDIERGKFRPTPETAMSIASVMGFDWTRFFEDTGQPSEERSTSVRR